jgi:hypothetical protein
MPDLLYMPSCVFVVVKKGNGFSALRSRLFADKSFREREDTAGDLCHAFMLKIKHLVLQAEPLPHDIQKQVTKIFGYLYL